jgi:hypothetical protein
VWTTKKGLKRLEFFFKYRVCQGLWRSQTKKSNCNFFLRFFCFVPTTFWKFTKKIKAFSHLPVCVCFFRSCVCVSGMCYSLCRRVFVFPGARLSLHKGHNPWHTLFKLHCNHVIISFYVWLFLYESCYILYPAVFNE